MQIFCHSNARTLCWHPPSTGSAKQHHLKLHHHKTHSSIHRQTRQTNTIPKLVTRKSGLSQCSQNYEGDSNHATQHVSTQYNVSWAKIRTGRIITVLYHTCITRGLCSTRHVLYSWTFHTQGRWAKPISRMSHLNLEGNQKKKLLACFLQALSPRSHTRT